MAAISDAPGAYATTFDVDPVLDVTLATEQLFGAGIFQKGPTVPTIILTERKLEKVFGTRIAGSVAYDSARAFLRAGRILRLQRIVGPAPVKSTKTLSNATPATVLRVDAIDYGVYGDSITVAIVAGTDNPSARVMVIAHTIDGELERSPEYTTQAEFAAWGAASNYVRVTVLGGSGLPVVSAAAPLVGGTDDHASITDAQRQAALDKFGDPRFGPGQVCMFGATTAGAYGMLIDHADKYDHHALLDMQDVANEATPIGAVQTLHDDAGAGRSSSYWPWGTLDGFPVAPSAMAAALLALGDITSSTDELPFGNPNQAAAGENGRLIEAGRPNIVDSLTQDVTEAQREKLNDAGVNVFWNVDGQGDLQLYGIRTLVDPDEEPLALLVPNVRLDMAIRAQCRLIGRRQNFKQLDGKKQRAAVFGAELSSMLRTYYQADALFGETEARAFKAETLAVNNAATAATLKLYGKVFTKRSPAAEQTLTEIYNFAVTVEI